jgi:hypothetical protein
MLQKATGWSNDAIHKLLHGYASRGSTNTGLLEKCPAIAFTHRTGVSDDEYIGFSTRRRANAYTYDHALFQAWSLGGTVGSGVKDLVTMILILLHLQKDLKTIL